MISMMRIHPVTPLTAALHPATPAFSSTGCTLSPQKARWPPSQDRVWYRHHSGCEEELVRFDPLKLYSKRT